MHQLIGTALGLEADDRVLEAEQTLEPGGHAFVELAFGLDLDLLDLGFVLEGDHAAIFVSEINYKNARGMLYFTISRRCLNQYGWR